MHPKDEILRALLDRELLAPQALKAQEHLTNCPTCQTRLEQLQMAAERVQARMNVMAPGPGEQAQKPHLAYARFIQKTSTSTHKKEPNFMFTRRPLWTALAVIAILALVFTLTPASAWASSFLGLFRVEKITVIQFDPQAASLSRDSMRENEEMIQQMFKDNVVMQGGGDAVMVDSVDAAADAAGFDPRLPAALENPQMAVQPGMQVVLTIEREKMQALLDVVEVDYELPRNVDGQQVTVESADTILTGYGCQPEQNRAAAASSDCVVLVQLPSPTINAPEGLNVQRLGEAMLQFLGLSKAEAQALSQRIDWTSTLILPLPTGEGIRYEELAVDGVTGTLVQEDGEDTYILMWVKDGFLYGLKGPGGAADALSIASSMQ
jgi:hypothetical protein